MDNGVETITHVGGRNSLGEIWSIKVEQAFEGFNSGNWEFFININGQTFPVEIQRAHHGIVIRSEGTENNLIWELSDCPN
jgi:hypothetical protein